MTLVAGREPKLGLGVLTLRLHAPRDVSLRHLFMTAFESRRLPALAVALTVALAMFEYAAGREARMGLTLRHALPIGLAGTVGACWSVVLGPCRVEAENIGWWCMNTFHRACALAAKSVSIAARNAPLISLASSGVSFATVMCAKP